MRSQTFVAGFFFFQNAFFFNSCKALTVLLLNLDACSHDDLLEHYMQHNAPKPKIKHHIMVTVYSCLEPQVNTIG